MSHPILIQAGMGIGVSDWHLARTVAKLGHMGVVSGTAIDSVLVRRLQTGDVGGHMRRALQAFPIPAVATKILNKYFRPDGISASESFSSIPMLTATPTVELQELLIVANFAEVFLAKEGHDGKIGINFLEKVQMAILPSIYGAMLADVDYVLMGAGIPREVPKVLDLLALHENVEYKLSVNGATAEDHFTLRFSPKNIFSEKLNNLKRPEFLAIISSAALAVALAKKASGKVNGFIIEASTAGGHNAPPRGKVQLSERGEPIYGPKDQPDFSTIAGLGLPFWLAGSRGGSEGLKSALQIGAVGIQVGTAFALCNESGLDSDLKKIMLQKIIKDQVQVFTDPLASPTGFPFKVALLENTNSEVKLYNERKRVCDLGYLREPYRKDDGAVGYRCASEPVNTFTAKGGKLEETYGRKCLCNALMSNIHLGQRRSGGVVENPLITIGDDIQSVRQLLKNGNSSYSAADVIDIIFSSTQEFARQQLSSPYIGANFPQ